ncbi:zinc transporter 1, partial [Aureobasidium melanogenum]
MIIISISFSFFVAEISVADAFHYLNDLIGFIVALVAVRVSKGDKIPQALSYGWQRAQLLGAFFNGVFLLALGVSIFLQSVERFVSLQKVENPMLVLIIGCVGLALNIISVLFLHEHDHDHDHNQDHETPQGQLAEAQDTGANEMSPLQDHSHRDHRHKVAKAKGSGHDLGMMGVLIHLVGDAINNIGVIIAAAVIWQAKYEGRFYADPGASMGIAFMILASSIPLVKNSGAILLESVPLGVNLEDVKHDLEKVEGVTSIHELHAWRLSQNKALASAHVLTSDDSLTNFMIRARRINECLHAYGIHSSTLQPELVVRAGSSIDERPQGPHRRPTTTAGCQIHCGSICKDEEGDQEEDGGEDGEEDGGEDGEEDGEEGKVVEDPYIEHNGQSMASAL